MSARYRQHFARAEPSKPQFNTSIVKGKIVDESDNGDGADDSPPIIITVVEILPDLSTPIPLYTTYQPDSLASASLETTTTVTVTGTNTLMPQISTSFTSLISSVPSSSIFPSSSMPAPSSSAVPSFSIVPSYSSVPSSSSTSFPLMSSGTPLQQETKAFSASSSSLKPGAIAGIIIVCVFAFLIGMFFAIRMCHRKKRASNLRKTWRRSGVLDTRYGNDAPEPSYEPKFTFRNGDSRDPALSVQIPTLSVPPVLYNNDAVLQDATTPVSSSLAAFTSPVYPPGLALLSPYSTTVVCTFIPSLPDELTIRVGETLRVVAEYEDGWFLCLDCRGEQGMVPNECLDRSSSSTGLLRSKGDYRTLTRITSLAQAARPGS